MLIIRGRQPTRHNIYCHGSWIRVLILCVFVCVCVCVWARSLGLSALPSYYAPDKVIRAATGVARLHCLYLAGVSVCVLSDHCQ